jgi:uncharacterized protein YukE
VIQAGLLADPGPVAVPAGDPAELRAAASTLSASAEALEGAAALAEAVVGAAVPAAWAGSAASSCASAQERSVTDCRTLVRAMREGAAAVAQLAAELDEAVSDARRAAAETEAARGSTLGAAAGERARLANLAAAAAFDRVAGTLAAIAPLGAGCAPVTRARLLAATGAPAEQDVEYLLGLGAFLAGGALVDYARKGKGKDRGSRAGPGVAPGGGPGLGGSRETLGRRQRAIGESVWSAKEAEEKALAMGFVKTNYRSMGQAVFRKGRRYISRDETSHARGAWKVAYAPDKLKAKETRLGTYNEDLTQRLGD